MEQQTEAARTAAELVVVSGGIEVEVHYQNNGAAETVKVRHIPISKMQEFTTTIGDESRSIELYCDKPKGWADTLQPESASKIATKGQKLNGPFFTDWWERQAEWRKMQAVWEGALADKSKKPATASQ